MSDEPRYRVPTGFLNFICSYPVSVMMNFPVLSGYSSACFIDGRIPQSVAGVFHGGDLVDLVDAEESGVGHPREVELPVVLDGVTSASDAALGGTR